MCELLFAHILNPLWIKATIGNDCVINCLLLPVLEKGNVTMGNIQGGVNEFPHDIFHFRNLGWGKRCGSRDGFPVVNIGKE